MTQKSYSTISERLDALRNDLEKREGRPMDGNLIRAFLSFKLTFLSSFLVKGEIRRGTKGFVNALFDGFENFFKKLY